MTLFGSPSSDKCGNADCLTIGPCMCLKGVASGSKLFPRWFALSASISFYGDEFGGWREEGVLFNSTRGQNSTNQSALGPAHARYVYVYD